MTLRVKRWEPNPAQNQQPAPAPTAQTHGPPAQILHGYFAVLAPKQRPPLSQMPNGAVPGKMFRVMHQLSMATLVGISPSVLYAIYALPTLTAGGLAYVQYFPVSPQQQHCILLCDRQGHGLERLHCSMDWTCSVAYVNERIARSSFARVRFGRCVGIT
jgi:hypothetical protein